jgi:DNA repair exonuclease SbcCD ATPase subunit
MKWNNNKVSEKKMKVDDRDVNASLMRKALKHLCVKAGNLVDSLAEKLQLRKVKEWRNKLREERDKHREEMDKHREEMDKLRKKVRLLKEITKISQEITKILEESNNMIKERINILKRENLLQIGNSRVGNRNKISTKNGLENYYGNMKTIDDYVNDKIFDDNILTIFDKLDEVSKWLDENQLAEVEELKNKLKELESVCNPIFTKLYQVAESMPEMGGGDGGLLTM